MSKKAAKLKKLDDLKGKTVVSTSGTTNIKQITELNTAQNLGLNILPAKDHAEAFLMVETGRAAAFVMDDILLYSLVAQARRRRRTTRSPPMRFRSSLTASCCARTTRPSRKWSMTP